MNYLANWRRYWREHLVHIAVGAFAGVTLTQGTPAVGAVLMALVISRQALEYHKRNDTPGIDLAYHIGGLIAGAVVGILWGSR